VTGFTPCDAATWPALLTLEQVAAITQRSADSIRHRCMPSSRRPFVPAPCEKYPLRWRKVDVLRYVEGARGVSSLRRAG
jgi:hypothetical protein